VTELTDPPAETTWPQDGGRQSGAADQAVQERLPSGFQSVLALVRASVAVQGLAFVRSVGVRAILGVEATGLWNLFQLMMTYAQAAGTGVQNAAQREVPYLRGKGDIAGAREVRALSFMVMLAEIAVLTLAFVLYISVFGARHPGEFYTLLLLAPMASAVIRVNSTIVSHVRAVEQFPVEARVVVAGAVLDVSAILGGAYLLDLVGVVIGLVASRLATLALLLVAVHRRRLFTIRPRYVAGRLADLVRTGIFLKGGQLAWTLFDSVDRLLVASLMGPSALATYALGYAITQPLGQVPIQVGTVMYPRLLRSYATRGALGDLTEELHRFFQGNFLVVIPPLVAAAGLGGYPLAQKRPPCGRALLSPPDNRLLKDRRR